MTPAPQQCIHTKVCAHSITFHHQTCEHTREDCPYGEYESRPAITIDDMLEELKTWIECQQAEKER